MITAEVAIFPLKTDSASEVINKSIDTLVGGSINYTVNSMNTRMQGRREDVFRYIEKMYNEAEKSGAEINMVITLGNAHDEDSNQKG